MICKGLKYKVTSHHSDDMGRLLLLNLEIDKQEFTVVNSRIDLVLCSSSLQSKCSRSVTAQAHAPDHRAVCLAIEINKGKGYWKLNNGHLEHEEYQEGIVRLYEEVIEEYDEYVTKSVLWDYFKLRVK